MTPTDPTTPRPPPLWVSIPVILLCLGGGGWIVHLYLKPGALTNDRTVLADAPSPASAALQQMMPQGRPAFLGGGGMNVRPQNRGGGGGGPAGGGNPNFTVRPLRGDTVEVRTAKSRVQFGTRNGDRLTVEQAYYNAVDFIPREARNTVDFMRVINGNLADRDKIIAAMSLTPDQLNRLRRVPRAPNMVLSEVDRARLTADYVAYRDASARERSSANDKAALATATAAAQAKMTSSIDDVAGKAMDPTAKAYVAQAAGINAVISADQWKQYQAFGGGK